MRRACRSLAVPALLVLALLLAACGDLGTKDEPPRPFGPGAGAGPIATPTPIPIAGVGALEYDFGYFEDVNTPMFPGDPDAMDLLDVIGWTRDSGTGKIQLYLAGIFGRPDTPCRFHAALAARDKGFTIVGDGEDRINEQGIVFHEVWLTRGAEQWRLDCAQLTGVLGLELLSASEQGGGLETEQVHFVLNSIRP
jgi:hypothetical protein